MVKAIVCVLYFRYSKDFINYSALFYEDGYFNPFIAEKNVMDFEEHQETELEMHVPKYVKRTKIGGVYNVADLEDYMTQRNNVSP